MMITRLLLHKVKILIYKPYARFRILRKMRRISKSLSGESVFFLLNTPSHGNLGDHFITCAERSFLNENWASKRIIYITSSELFYGLKQCISKIRSKDVVFITGGGFLGSLYTDESRITKIVQRLSHNKIVFFPQSVFYDESKKGIVMREKAASVYRSHPLLFFSSRDLSTFELVNTSFLSNNLHRSLLLPDIALYLDYQRHNDRQKVLFCIRKDDESIINYQTIEILKHNLISKGFTYSDIDTYHPCPISAVIDTNGVNNKLKEFSSAILVITDRLHGMIFSAITGTPALVFDNLTKKNSQVYNLWLNQIPYIRFFRDIDNIDNDLDELLSSHHYSYSHYCDSIRKYFKPLIHFIDE